MNEIIRGQYDKCAKLLRFLVDMPQEERGRFRDGYLWPPHVAVFSTAACQLSCSHCTFANRDRSMSIPWTDLEDLLTMLEEHPTWAIEHSGGEPTLYPHFEDMARLIADMQFKQGLLTNGLLLPKYEHVLDAFSWIRVSLDAFTLGKAVPLFALPYGVRLTASYIWNEHSTRKMLDRCVQWCHKMGAVGLRVVPDVWLPLRGPRRREARRAVDALSDSGLAHLVDRDEERRPPTACLTAWLKPTVAWDGFVYPCCYGTTYEWERAVPKRYRVCHMSQFEEFFETRPMKDLGWRCSNCLGWQQNDILRLALADVEDPEFL